MGKVPSFGIFLPLLLAGCSSTYLIHVKTIPSGNYGIYVDNRFYGNTPACGDTVVQTEKLPAFKFPLLEVKNEKYYGCLELNRNDSVKSTNVLYYKFLRDTNNSLVKKYNVTFLYDLSRAPNILQNSTFSTNVNKRYYFPDFYSSQTCYCVSNLNLLQAAREDYSTENMRYERTKKIIDGNVHTKKFQWKPADEDLARRITLGFAQDSLSGFDSLPYAAWDLCLSLNIKYLIVYFGFFCAPKSGFKGDRIPKYVVASLLGRLTGLPSQFIFAAATEGSTHGLTMGTSCAIFSVPTRKCVFRTRKSSTRFGNFDAAAEMNSLYGKLFAEMENIFKNQ